MKTIMVAAAALMAMLCISAPYFIRADDTAEDRIIIFSIQDGTTDMILIESNGHYGLVDASNASGPDIFPTEVTPDLYDEVDNGKNHGTFIRDILGVDHLDFILATHAHSDHIGGITEIAELGLVNSSTVLIYKEYQPVTQQEDIDWHNIELVDMAKQAVEDSDGKVVMISTDSPETTDYSLIPGCTFHAEGDGSFDDHISFRFGDFMIDLFNLYSRAYTGSENANSIMTLITKENRHMLLMSDMNNADYIGADLASAISGYIGGAKIDLLKDGHHGSQYGSNTQFEAECYRPAIDITSVAWSGDTLKGNISNYKYYCEKNYGTLFYAAGDSDRAVVADITDGTVRIENMLDDGSYDAEGMPLNSRISVPGWVPWDSGKAYVKTGSIDWFFFNEHGEWAEGIPQWGTRSTDRFYIIPTEDNKIRGKAVTGWNQIDDDWYYFDHEGVMATRWVQIDDNWYYFGSDGVRETGLTVIGSKKYYFNDEGIMETGWKQLDGKWYYFRISGAMATGWVQDRGKWYFMDEEGVMATGWIRDGEKKYYLKSSGEMATGWLPDGEQWYYLKPSGAAATGWIQDRGKWYFMDEEGVMATGWIMDNGKKYYMKASGAMATGWLKDRDNWYYLQPSGRMAENEWITYKGKQYYLKADGAMAANEWVPGYWWVSSDGVWSYKYKASWHQNSKGRWFGDTSGWYARDSIVIIDGERYAFDNNGYIK